MSNKLTNKPVNVQNIEQFTEHEQGKEMNANELALQLGFYAETYDGDFGECLKNSATMLRQQQAEKEIRDRYIEGMKSHISEIQAENGKLKMTLLAVTQGIQIPSMQGPMPKGVTE